MISVISDSVKPLLSPFIRLFETTSKHGDLNNGRLSSILTTIDYIRNQKLILTKSKNSE